jgi:catechol 2,3-dioxygenase-like lactoylglutathione lyase family enzyme
MSVPIIAYYLAMLKKIDHIGIAVADLAASRPLFEQVLGLELVRENSSERARFAFFRLGDSEIELVEFLTPERREATLRGETMARLDHIAVEVEDLDRATAELRTQGIEHGELIKGMVGNSVITDPKTTGGVTLQLVERTR